MNTKDEIFTRFKNELPLNFFGLHEEEKDQIFDWWWKEIAQREVDATFWKKSFENRTKDFKNSEDKIHELEQLIKAADEVISFKGFISYGNEVEYKKALDSYTTLKQQSAPI